MLIAEDVQRLRLSGLRISQIAAQLCAPVRSVRWLVEQMIDTGEIAPRAERWTHEQERALARMVADKLGDAEIAARVGRSTIAVATKRQRMRHLVGQRPAPWTASEDEMLRSMVAARRPDDEIAAALGRTARAVIKRRHALGLRRG